MHRIVYRSLLPFLLFVSFFARAEAPAEPGVPEFAVAKLSIGKLGPFLEKIGDLANQVVPNAGPLTKIVLSNLLFKVPVDESLVYEGPTQIYFAGPFSASSLQDTAIVLPVNKADLFKKNLAAIAADGEVAEKDGVLTFKQSQAIPLPDRTMFCKIVNDKALLAPSAELLAKLEKVVNAPAMTGSDAELLVSVPALKKFYGPLVDFALQEGGKQAAENVDALKKLTGQLDTIQKTLWEIDTLEMRLNFDKGSMNASAELAIAAQDGTKLAGMLANPPAALEGKDTALLAANAPINFAYRMNGQPIFEMLTKWGLEPERGRNVEQKAFDYASGETTFAVDIAKKRIWQTQRAAGDPLSKKIETLQQAVIDFFNKSAKENGDPEAPTYSALSEKNDYRGNALTFHKLLTNNRNSVTIFSEAVLNGANILASGRDAEAALREFIDATQANTPIAPELKAAFDAPQSGTLLLVSAKMLEIIRIAAIEQLNIDGDQLVGGLPDAPVFTSVFMAGGKAGLRGTLPGSTIKSLYAVIGRLRRHGIKLDDLLNMGDKTDDVKLPRNIPPPPPQK